MRVANKSIIVTGSGGGIGEGIAKRLAAEGARVLVNDLNEAGGQRVCGEINQAGGKAFFFKSDVTHSADMKALTVTDTSSGSCASPKAVCTTYSA